MYYCYKELELNEDKTKFLAVHPKHKQVPPLDSITVGHESIEPSGCARNIGVVFDHNFCDDLMCRSQERV